jgi:hypothetical protein
VEKGKKTELEVVTENKVSWAQLQHYANSPTEGLPVTKPKRRAA